MSYMVFTARRRLDDLAGAVYETVFYDAMAAILNEGLWRSYVHDVTGKTYSFNSMDEFLTSDNGLGIQDLGLFRRCMEAVATSPGAIAASAKNLLKRLKEEAGMSAALPEIAPLPAHGEIGGGHTRGDNITSTERGTSQAYLLRRLQRDRPDLLEQVKTGEFKSARAAAIEAGIIKPVPTVRLVDDLNKVAASITKHLTNDQRIQLAELLLPDA